MVTSLVGQWDMENAQKIAPENLLTAFLQQVLGSPTLSKQQWQRKKGLERESSAIQFHCRLFAHAFYTARKFVLAFQ